MFASVLILLREVVSLYAQHFSLSLWNKYVFGSPIESSVDALQSRVTT